MLTGSRPVFTRALSLDRTLRAARLAAKRAGVTRVADLSRIDAFVLPLVQAVRPLGRSLSVTMGKGATMRAATVSALMEAIEIDAAERVEATVAQRSVAQLGGEARRLWHDGARGARAIRLDPRMPRDWVEGFDVRSGEAVLLPLNLVSLDYTRPTARDAFRTSVGLASGTTPTEALVAAVAELVEHHLAATWKAAAIARRSACRIDLASIDEPAVASAIGRIVAAGREVRLWAIAGDHDIAAFECVIVDRWGTDTNLPPVRGTACHPDRGVAALGAVLEAAQSRAAMIAGSRDDLTPEQYREGETQTRAFLLSLFALPDAPLAWTAVPHSRRAHAQDDLAQLLRVAGRLTSLPVLAAHLAQPHPSLHVAKAVAPGLESLARGPGERRRVAAAAIVPTKRPEAGRLLFAGPSLHRLDVPCGIAVRAPAVAGDLAALLPHPPAAVALVDGCFETAPSVQHKEVLDLIAAGVTVFGAASLGAIRAAELHDHGMIGVGAIFEAYRTGRVRRDDAVMLRHAPAELGHRPLTLALVDMEAALVRADLPPAERRMLQRLVRTIGLRERTWEAVLRAYAQRTGRRSNFVPDRHEAQKQEDTRAVIARLAGPLPVREPPPRPPLTDYYRDLLVRGDPGAGHAVGDELAILRPAQADAGIDPI